MTDTELDALEAAAKAATPGPWKAGRDDDALFINNNKETIAEIVSDLALFDSLYIAAANPAAILELIAELRQTKKERDWIADYIAILTGKKSYNTKEHWIKAAKEATCQK